jgi:hypothetical protein
MNQWDRRRKKGEGNGDGEYYQNTLYVCEK